MTSATLSCGHRFTPVLNAADLFARYLSGANVTLVSLSCLFARGFSRKCLYFTFLIPRIQSSALSSANGDTKTDFAEDSEKIPLTVSYAQSEPIQNPSSLCIVAE